MCRMKMVCSVLFTVPLSSGHWSHWKENGLAQIPDDVLRLDHYALLQNSGHNGGCMGLDEFERRTREAVCCSRGWGYDVLL